MSRFSQIRPYLEDGVPLSRVAKDCTVTLRTLRRWVNSYRKHGLVGLVNQETNETASSEKSTLIQCIEGLALQRPRMAITSIHRKACAVARQQGLRAPSYHAVYRIVNSIDPALMTMAQDGAKVYSETYDLIHRREANAPNEIWQADHTLLDIWVLDKDKTARKPWLTIVLDDYSRAVAGYLLSFSAPSALQTSLALRQAIWRKPQPGWRICGIPQVLYTDHGSDFTSRHLEQVLADLKVQLVFSGVGRPRGRGKIERFFGTINQVFLSRFPGYSPSGTQRAAKLTLSDLTREFESYLLTEYLVTEHSTTGETPQARWQSGSFLPRMPDSLEQLDLLLLTVPKMRRVQQDGIQFMGYRYISPTLAGFVGEQVIRRGDPRDMAEVRVYHQEQFICKAVSPELAGQVVPYREIANARNRRRRELRKQLAERQEVVESLLASRRWSTSETSAELSKPSKVKPKRKIKRYRNE